TTRAGPGLGGRRASLRSPRPRRSSPPARTGGRGQCCRVLPWSSGYPLTVPLIPPRGRSPVRRPHHGEQRVGKLRPVSQLAVKALERRRGAPGTRCEDGAGRQIAQRQDPPPPRVEEPGCTVHGQEV